MKNNLKKKKFKNSKILQKFKYRQLLELNYKYHNIFFKKEKTFLFEIFLFLFSAYDLILI